MIKTSVSIPESTAVTLDAMAKELHSSRSVLIGQAVEAWLKKQSGPEVKTQDLEEEAERLRLKEQSDLVARTFGILKKYNIDGLEFQRRIREEW